MNKLGRVLFILSTGRSSPITPVEKGSTSISSSAQHSFTSGPSGDDYEEQANAERQAYEEPAADPHDIRGLRGP